MNDRSRAEATIYGGLFLTTLSTLTYEILLTRIFSVTMWYHFAFVAISVALFGLTVGALIVHLWPSRFPEDRTRERIFQATLLFSLSIVATFTAHLFIPFDPQWSAFAISRVALIYLLISVPFIFSGIAVSLTLTRFPSQVSRLYAVDLVGAALGTVTLIWLLNLLGDGPSVVLAVAALAALGAASFAHSLRPSRGQLLAMGVAVCLALLAFGNAVSVQQHKPILRVFQAKGQAEGVPLYETWNEFSRVRIVGDPNALGNPSGPGLSSRYPGAGGTQVRQLSLTIDAAAATVLTGYDGDRESLEYLQHDVVNLVHYIRPGARVLVIGSGGGRDVLAALSFDQPSVTAVEMNGAILDAVNERFGDFTGHLDEQPGVSFVNDEARSYLARSDARFDIIQIPFIDTWAATAAGAFALSENSLYTVEAWESFLEHLDAGGVLSISRWYAPKRPLEAYRLTSLAGETLRRYGISRPSDHVIIARSREGHPDIDVTTVLVSPDPFSASDVAGMRRAISLSGFEVLLAPDDLPQAPIFQRLLEADDPSTVDLGFPMDISAPTDDRPFFFQMLRFQDLFDPSSYEGLNELVTRPVLTLFSLAVAVLALAILCIVVPLLVATSRRALRGMVPFIVFFCGIGLGFLLLEISQMQRLTIFLGHPTYALSVVLFSLLLSSGAGSLATERLVTPSPRLRISLLLPLGLLMAVLLILGFATPGIIDRFQAMPTPGRIAVAVGLLAPMGFVMGMPFPLGMKVASVRPNAPTVFFWGINGATSVSASVLAVVIAMGWGISSAFWVGCVSYAVATVAMGLVVIRGRV